MRKVWLDYIETLNSTEVLLVFKTLFNKKEYGTYTIVNLAEPTHIQDELIERCVLALGSMKREDARAAKQVE